MHTKCRFDGIPVSRELQKMSKLLQSCHPILLKVFAVGILPALAKTLMFPCCVCHANSYILVIAVPAKIPCGPGFAACRRPQGLCELMRCGESLVSHSIKAARSTLILGKKPSWDGAGMALISPARGANVSLTTSTRCVPSPAHRRSGRYLSAR